MKKTRKILIVSMVIISVFLLLGLFACGEDNEKLEQKYIVSFYDGDTLIKSMQIVPNQEIVLPTTPTKEGYEFSNWHIANDKNSAVVTKDYFISNPPSKNINVYAIFAKIPGFSITFMNGEVEYEKIYSSGNELLDMPSEPILAKSDFDGWYFDLETLDKQLVSTSYQDKALSENIIVYAHFIPYEKFDINFIINEEVIKSVNTCGYESISSPTPVVIEHYEFFSWYFEDMKTEYTNDFYSQKRVVADVNIIAKYELIPYNPIIKFHTGMKDLTFSDFQFSEYSDENGYNLWACTMQNIEVEEGLFLEVPILDNFPNILTDMEVPSGRYYFEGWTTDSSLAGTKFSQKIDKLYEEGKEDEANQLYSTLIGFSEQKFSPEYIPRSTTVDVYACWSVGYNLSYHINPVDVSETIEMSVANDELFRHNDMARDRYLFVVTLELNDGTSVEWYRTDYYPYIDVDGSIEYPNGVIESDIKNINSKVVIYNFAGWYTSNEGGTMINVGDDVRKLEILDVYARYLESETTYLNNQYRQEVTSSDRLLSVTLDSKLNSGGIRDYYYFDYPNLVVNYYGDYNYTEFNLEYNFNSSILLSTLPIDSQIELIYKGEIIENSGTLVMDYDKTNTITAKITLSNGYSYEVVLLSTKNLLNNTNDYLSGLNYQDYDSETGASFSYGVVSFGDKQYITITPTDYLFDINESLVKVYFEMSYDKNTNSYSLGKGFLATCDEYSGIFSNIVEVDSLVLENRLAVEYHYGKYVDIENKAKLVQLGDVTLTVDLVELMSIYYSNILTIEDVYDTTIVENMPEFCASYSDGTNTLSLSICGVGRYNGDSFTYELVYGVDSRVSYKIIKNGKEYLLKAEGENLIFDNGDSQVVFVKQ